MNANNTAANDAELLDAFRGGSSDALEQLYERYRVSTFTYLLSLMRSREEAEDAFHELWMRIIERVRNGGFDGHFKSYLYVSARNLAADRQMSIQRQRLKLAELPLLRERASSRGADAEFEITAALHAALDSLSDEQRETVVLKTWCELTFAELAEVIDIPPGTAMTRYRTGIANLKEKMKKYGPV